MSWSASLTLADVPAWIEPGRETNLTATIVNHGTAPDEFQLSVRGIDPAWVTFRPPVIRLAPGEAGQAGIAFNPPTTAILQADDPVIRLLSRRAGTVIAEVSTNGTIPPPEPIPPITPPRLNVPTTNAASTNRVPMILGGAGIVLLLCLAVGVGGYILYRGGRAASPMPSPTTVPVAAPEPTAVTALTATAPRATASARASATAQTFVVGNTGGDGVFLRRTANFEDRDPPALADGTRLVQIGADVTSANVTYHYVRAPDGRTGYVPVQFTIAGP